MDTTNTQPSTGLENMQDEYAQKYGFHDAEQYVFKTRKGLDAEIVHQISEMKGEPRWMRDYRLKALEICSRDETRSMVHYISSFVGDGLRQIQATYPDWFVGIRQNGVVMGLEFAHPQGAKFVMKRLYENGVWAIFSTLDPRVLQYKPGILVKPELAEELLDRTEVGAIHQVDDCARPFVQ